MQNQNHTQQPEVLACQGEEEITSSGTLCKSGVQESGKSSHNSSADNIHTEIKEQLEKGE